MNGIPKAPNLRTAAPNRRSGVDTASLIQKVDRYVAEHDLERRMLDNRFGLALTQEEQFWLDIYPRLRPRRCEPRQMLEDWRSRERKKIVFLYLHVPFCAQHCDFCYFHITTDPKRMREYVDRLEAEIRSYLRHVDQATPVGDLFIGGGTPSMLPYRYLRQLLECIYSSIDREGFGQISLELHPRTMAKGLSQLAVDGLINRATMGVQTFSRQVLEANHRIWVSPDRIRRIASEYREAGVEKISVDFMAGLYRQTVEETARDIEVIDSLIEAGLITSISVYPRSFNYNSQVMQHEVIDGHVLLEKLRIEQLYRSYFAHRGWSEHLLYHYLPESLPPPKPSALSSEEGDVSAIGFGNSARSYFDRTNYLNTNLYDQYLKVMGSHEAATGTYHRLSGEEVKRRFLMFGAKSGHVELGACPVPFTDDEREELEGIHGRLEAQGFIRRDGDRIELEDLGRLLIQCVQREYHRAFRQA